MTDINGIFSFCEAVGTAAFAVSGAMVAVDRGTDIFGVLLMAVFTALGGGTLRDMLIGYFPPRMFTCCWPACARSSCSSSRGCTRSAMSPAKR